MSLKTKDFGDQVVNSARPADVKSRPDDRVSNCEQPLDEMTLKVTQCEQGISYKIELPWS